MTMTKKVIFIITLQIIYHMTKLSKHEIEKSDQDEN